MFSAIVNTLEGMQKYGSISGVVFDNHEWTSGKVFIDAPFLKRQAYKFTFRSFDNTVTLCGKRRKLVHA